MSKVDSAPDSRQGKLARPPAPAGERRAAVPSNLPSGTVTFFFTDIEGSTRLWEQYPESMKAALARHDTILQVAVEAHAGRVIKTTGDGIHAVFDALIEAVAAALRSIALVDILAWFQHCGYAINPYGNRSRKLRRSSALLIEN